MEGVLVLMIPVLALATGLVAVLRMPREALAPRRDRHLGPASTNPALEEEVAMLREEVAQLRERVDFTERLLSPPNPTNTIAPAQTPSADPLARPSGS